MDLELKLEEAYKIKVIEKLLKKARSKGFDICGMELSEDSIIIKCR